LIDILVFYVLLPPSCKGVVVLCLLLLLLTQLVSAALTAPTHRVVMK
jgi:hypothetical protein